MAEFDTPMRTDFFNGVGVAGVGKTASLALPTVAEVRGYEPDQLHGLAEVATHYLLNGGLRLAQTIFEGLVAVAPREPYYVTGLGLTYSQQGRQRRAEACFRAAARLDPKDPRPELNLAELALASGERSVAIARLLRSRSKALASGQVDLEHKATALLRRLLRRT